MKKLEHTKRILFTVALVVLLLPWFQNQTNLVSERELKGSFPAESDISFSYQSWNSGKYQEQKMRYLTYQLGFRSTFIRLYNHIRFALFKKSSVSEMVIGRKNYLYTIPNLKAYTGEDFVGSRALAHTSSLISTLQKKLALQGKVLLPILCPSKARILPEFLPSEYSKGDSTNYDQLIVNFKKEKVDFIDFNAWFEILKGDSKFPLYPQYGVHWSSYGHSLAADSLLEYLRQKYRFEIGKTQWKNQLILSRSQNDFDYDAGEALNLLGDQLPSTVMAYSDFQFPDTGSNKPSLMTVGDSYNFGFECTGIHIALFNDYLFLYFNKIPLPPTLGKTMHDIRLKEEIDKHQIILLVTTEQSLNDYGWGFLEKTLNILNGLPEEMEGKAEQRLREKIGAIKGDEYYLALLKKEALENGVDLDSLILKKARIELMFKKGKPGEIPLLRMMLDISKHAEWMVKLKENARKKNISVDSAMVLDALWILDN